MGGFLLLCSIPFALGIYCLLAQFLNLPTLAITRTALSLSRLSRTKTKRMDAIVMELSMRVSTLVHIDDYRRSNLEKSLKAANIMLAPEVWMAKCYVRFCLFLLLIIPAAIIFPIMIPAILILSIRQLYTDLKAPDMAVRKKKEEIESDLPRFASTLSQELKNSRNILTILESYKKSARPAFRSELEITIAGMKSGNYENALSRLDSRVRSDMLSQVVLGLQAVLRGDNGINYFELLANDFDKIEYKQLKKEAAKIPSKINICTAIVFVGFMLIIFYILGMQIYQAFASFV